MKTNIIFLLVALLVVLKTQLTAQNPLPQIVISPQLLAPLTNMEKMQERLEIVRKSASVISTLRSIQKFVSVIEQTNCTTLRMLELIQELEIYGSPILRSCSFEVKYNAGVYGLNSAVDMTNTMLAALEIEPGDRVKLAMDTMEKYSNVQGDILDLNKELEEQVEIEKKRMNDAISYKKVFNYAR